MWYFNFIIHVQKFKNNFAVWILSRKVEVCKTGGHQSAYIEYFFSACFLNSFDHKSIKCEIRGPNVSEIYWSIECE